MKTMVNSLSRNRTEVAVEPTLRLTEDLFQAHSNQKSGNQKHPDVASPACSTSDPAVSRRAVATERTVQLGPPVHPLASRPPG